MRAPQQFVRLWTLVGGSNPFLATRTAGAHRSRGTSYKCRDLFAKRAGSACLSSILLAATFLIALAISAPSNGRTLGRHVHVRHLVLHPCRVADVKEALRCGTYGVLENRARPSGRKLPLRVVTIPARHRTLHAAPIFVLAGGPGEAATEYASDLVRSWERENNDVILIDQRGTGPGHQLDCVPPPPSNLQGYLGPVFGNLSFWRDCAKSLERHADLTQYATPVAVQDIDEVRRALGYDKINLEGGSYGSRVGLIYIKMFGTHVRSAFLSGLIPLSIRSPLFHPAGAQFAFEGLVADCQADPECNSVYPDINGDLDAVRNSLRAHPVRVAVRNPVTGASEEVLLSEQAFTEALRRKLYSLESARTIPLILRKARAGEFKQITEELIKAGPHLFGGIHWGMALAANCTEDTARITPQDVARETAGSFVGPSLVLDKMEVCRLWPEAKLPKDYFKPYRSNIPVLLMSASRDLVAPPRWGEEASRSLPNSLQIIIPSGHSYPDDPCIASMAETLFRTGSVKGIDTSCIKSMHTPKFAFPDDGQLKPRR